MWKLIKIAQRSYVINCVFGDDDVVTFILYDHKESWCETLTRDELKRKAKLFNRRYDFSEENVRETLVGGDLEMATLELVDTIRSEKIALKLKYRVKNCPFHYEWSLKKQTMLEFQNTFVRPLCTALMGCHEQIEILTASLKKKDAEILQYRKEGAILSRKTLATKLFDFEEFAKKYEVCNKFTSDFGELGTFVLSAAEPTKDRKPSTSIRVKEQRSPENKEASLKKQNITSWSPGQRKRKIQELKQKHLERNMKTRKQNIVYESSQSQENNSSSSQSTDFDFEQKKPDLKPTTTLAQNVEELVEDLKSISDSAKKLQEEGEDTKSCNTNTQKVQENLQDLKLTSGATQTAEQKDRDIKSTSDTAASERDNKDQGTTTHTTVNTSSTPVEAKISSKYSQPKDDAVNKSIEIQSDSDSDDIILTPRKCTQLRNTRKTTPKVAKTDSESDSDDTIKTPRKGTRNLDRLAQEDSVKSLEKHGSKKDSETKMRNENKQKALRCLAFNDDPTVVVEISTDSDGSEHIKSQSRRYPQRRNTTCTPTKSKGRSTRSSPQATGVDSFVQKRRRNSVGMSAEDFKIFESSSKNKSQRTTTKPIIVGEISSQLNAIRKELQSLEALRLADLEKRTCKA